MSESQRDKFELTAVDDVRVVREKISRKHGGNLREHIEETNRLGEQLRAKLNVRLVPTPKVDASRTGTVG